jgi:hypothetical protein
MAYLMLEASLSSHRYLVEAPLEYLELWTCTEWRTKFSSVFIGFHTLKVCLLFLKLLVHYHSSVILCSLSCCQEVMGEGA